MLWSVGAYETGTIIIFSICIPFVIFQQIILDFKEKCTNIE